MKMKSEDKSIGRESGAGIRDPKRIKTEKSGQDAGTKKETAASEVSGKADLTESRARVDLPPMSLPPGVAGNAKLRNSLRKYSNPPLSPFQLANFDLLDCFDEIRHKEELIEEYSRMAADPCLPPAEAQRFREKAFRSFIEELCLRNGRLPQLKSDLAVARRMTVTAQQGAGEGKVIENSPPTKQKRKLSREEKDGRKKGGEQRSVIEDEDAKKILAENERRGKPRSIRGRANLLKKWCATKEILRKDENPITSRNIESLLLNKKRQRRLNMC